MALLLSKISLQEKVALGVLVCAKIIKWCFVSRIKFSFQILPPRKVKYSRKSSKTSIVKKNDTRYFFPWPWRVIMNCIILSNSSKNRCGKNKMCKENGGPFKLKQLRNAIIKNSKLRNRYFKRPSIKNVLWWKSAENVSWIKISLSSNKSFQQVSPPISIRPMPYLN